MTAHRFRLCATAASALAVDLEGEPEPGEPAGNAAVRAGMSGAALVLEAADLDAARWALHELANDADARTRSERDPFERAFQQRASRALTTLADAVGRASVAPIHTGMTRTS